MEFGKRLAQIRKEMKLSQSELANMHGIQANVIGRYERVLARPFVEIAVALDYLDEDEQKTIFKIVDAFNRYTQPQKAYAS